MKKILYGTFLRLSILTISAQSNGFIIGTWNSTYHVTYGSGGLMSATSDNNGNPTSSLNILSQDGFNLSTITGPDNSLTYYNYKNYMQLCQNNGMKISDVMAYWFRPQIPSSYVQQCQGGSLNTLSQNPPSYSLQFNDGPYSTGTDYYNQAVFENYDALFSSVFNDPSVPQNHYSHWLGGEFNYFHLYPKFNPNAPSNNPADNTYYCDGFLNTPPSCVCTSGVQKFFPTEVPPVAISDAAQHFKGLATAQSGHKYTIGVATHNNSIVNLDNNNEAPWHQPPYNGSYFSKDYLLYNYGVNKPDMVNEASYYNGFGDWVGTNSFVGYMGKFDNIDYLHMHKFNTIIAEHDVATNFGENSHELHSNPPIYANGVLTPGIPNGNMLRFLTYTSIIHGIDGINLYTLPDMFNDQTHPVEFYDLSGGQDKTNLTKWTNGTQPLSDRFQRNNFPYVYKNFVYKLARELRYLANQNLIAPYNYNTQNGYQIVTKKTNVTLGSAQITPTVIPNTSTLPYLPATVSGADAQDLVAVGAGSAPFTNNHRGEDFGLRYVVTTNGTDAIMIVSNPNPYSIHNISFDFNNKIYGVAPFDNSILPNTKAIDVLFEDGQVTDVTSSNYKTDPSASVDDANSSPAFKLLKKYSIPFCNKTFTSDFGPFDVKVFKFNTSGYEGNSSFNTAGWQKNWSNNGDGAIGGWGGPGYLSATDKFIQVDIDRDGAEELLCVQALDATGTNVVQAGVKKYNSNTGSWSGVWDNGGNGSFASTFSGWGIHADDKYLPGDFDGDGYNNEILCVHQGWASILRSNGTAPYSWSIYWSNNGNGNLRAGGGLWTISTADKFQVGDFNGDGSNNDLLCVRAANNGTWSLLNFSHTASPMNFFNIWTGTNGLLFNNASWPIHVNDEFYVGDFDGVGNTTTGNGKNDVLCLERGVRAAGLKKVVGSLSSATHWTSTGMGITNFPGWTVTSTDKILVGDVDNAEATNINKDEIMFIQTGATASFATTEDLNSSMQPQWNWSNHNNGYAQGTQNYIADWLLKDACASDVKYLFIKPVTTDKNYLLTFKNYQNNTYLISMYQANGAYNYREISTNETTDSPSISGFDFKLYPNPNNGSFTISNENTIEKNITITDLVGRTIAEMKSSEADVTIKLPEGTKGIYFVKMDDGTKVGIKKIIVE